jgi:hypothetical protein
MAQKNTGQHIMKLTQNYFHIALLTVMLAIAGCEQITGQVSSDIPFLIDNPTNAVMKVSIDGKAIDIPPMSGHKISLAPGVHRLQSPLTKGVEFMVYDSKDRRGALINPSFSTYVLMQEVYAVDNEAAKRFGPIESKVVLDGVEFVGLLQMREGFFIDRDWRYDVHEDFPKQITVYGDEKGGIPNKLFNKTDFVAYYETNYGSPGNYAKQRTPEAPPQVAFKDYSALPSFQSPRLETEAKRMKDLYVRYLASRDTAELEKIRGEYFDAQMSFTRRYVDLGQNLSTQDREAYNELVTKLSELLSLDARVLPQKPAP